MSKQDDQLTIGRILVALDASHHSLAALEAAAELAASMEAEIRYPSVVPVRLDRVRMERALRAQAAQAHQALARACEGRHIKWSFRVVRGEVAPEVLAAAMEADLLTLGKASRPLTLRVRLGSTARAAAARAPCCVLLLQRDVGIRPPVLVTYDGTPSTQQALTMAARLAQKQGGDLTILIIADAPDAAQRLQAQVSDLLRGRGLAVRYRRLTDPGAATLIHEVRTEGSGVLVLSSTVLPQETLQTLLDEVGCPVLLMRQHVGGDK